MPELPSRTEPPTQPMLRLMPFGVTIAYAALASSCVLIWITFISPMHPDSKLTGAELAAAFTFVGASAIALFILLRVVFARVQSYEAALAESESRYMTLFNTANDAMFVHEIAPNGLPGKFIDVNRVACTRLGYSREELLEMTPLDIDTAEASENAPHIMETFARTGYIVFQGTHKTRGGKVIPVEISARRFEYQGKTSIFSIARDISERKKAEENLRKLNRAIEQTPLAIVIASGDGVVEYVNPAFSIITGYDAGEIIGETSEASRNIVFPKPVREEVLATVQNGNRWQGDFRNTRKDGEEYRESAVISPVRDLDGNIVNIIAIKEDITERHNLEENLRHVQKMEAVGQLSGGIAHDFKNVLTVIGGYANLIKRKAGSDFPYRPYIDQILNSCEKAVNLTKGLLAFSRKEPSNPELLDVNDIIENLEEFLCRVIGEDIILDIRTTSKSLPVMVDGTQIEQVLMNFATNARDAMPNGGTITIATGYASVDEEFTSVHGAATPGEYATIMVRDEGEGIDEEIMHRIFEPFFTTKDTEQGTGLGLSIVYGIVRQHKGFITCESHPGKGTLFTVYLPLSSAPDRNSERMDLAEDESAGQETILLVEDDDMVRNIMRALLSEYGYHVIDAVSGEVAIDLFAEKCDEIDIMILDVIMPGTNGRQVFDACRHIRPDVKVLFISGYDQNIISTKGRLEEGFNFLSKPIIPAELLEKVRSILDTPAANA